MRRPLYAVFVADLVSLVGNVVAQVAIPWFVLVTTGSAALAGVAVFFNFLPVVIAGIFGGAVIDRFGFRTTSIAADLASAAATAAIPLLHATVGIELWQLMALVFVGALLDAPGMTARQSLFPDLVRDAGTKMERATGIRAAIQQGSWLIGAPIGGVLVAAFGATTALWLNAGSFVVSAALVVIWVPRNDRADIERSPGRYLHEVAEGLRFIWSHRLLRAVVVTVLVTNLLDAPFPVLMPAFARDAFGSATDLGLMYGALGGGALVGALAFSVFGHLYSRRWMFVGCFLGLPLSYLALATLPSLPVALAALAISGVASGPINPLLNVVQFEQVPAAIRGRVFGAVKAGAWSTIPLGVLAGGVVVESIGVGTTFLAIGIGYTAVTLYGVFNPVLRDMDRRPPRFD